MKTQDNWFRSFAYLIFGVGIASIGSAVGTKCCGYDISQTTVQIFGAVCLIFGSSWLARTDPK